NVPPGLKLKGFLSPTTKHIFRRAMADLLPDEVLRQPKAGFAAPTDYWLANDLTEMTDDLLSESRVRDRGLFRADGVQKMIRQHRAGKQDWSMQIWQMLTLELWMQSFMDGTGSRVGRHAEAAIAWNRSCRGNVRANSVGRWGRRSAFWGGREGWECDVRHGR